MSTLKALNEKTFEAAGGMAHTVTIILNEQYPENVVTPATFKASGSTAKDVAVFIARLHDDEMLTKQTAIDCLRWISAEGTDESAAATGVFITGVCLLHDPRMALPFVTLAALSGDNPVADKLCRDLVRILSASTDDDDRASEAADLVDDFVREARMFAEVG